MSPCALTLEWRDLPRRRADIIADNPVTGARYWIHKKLDGSFILRVQGHAINKCKTQLGAKRLANKLARRAARAYTLAKAGAA